MRGRNVSKPLLEAPAEHRSGFQKGDTVRIGDGFMGRCANTGLVGTIIGFEDADGYSSAIIAVSMKERADTRRLEVLQRASERCQWRTDGVGTQCTLTGGHHGEHDFDSRKDDAMDFRLPIDGGPPWTTEELAAEETASTFGGSQGAGWHRKQYGVPKSRKDDQT